MAILRHRHSTEFTVIPNSIFKDKNLNLKDIGLLCFLIHLPDDWEFTVNGLVAVLPNDGKDSITKSLKRIEDAGYIRREQERLGDGTMSRAVWIVSDTPLTENPSAVNHPQTKKENNKEQIKLNLIVHSPESNGRADFDEKVFDRLASEYGEERSQRMIEVVDRYIDEWYPARAGRKHPSETKKKRALFAEKLLMCASELGLDDDDMASILYQAAKYEQSADPTIYFVTTPSVLGYWITMHPDYGYQYIKDTEYAVGPMYQEG